MDAHIIDDLALVSVSKRTTVDDVDRLLVTGALAANRYFVHRTILCRSCCSPYMQRVLQTQIGHSLQPSCFGGGRIGCSAAELIDDLLPAPRAITVEANPL